MKGGYQPISTELLDFLPHSVLSNTQDCTTGCFINLSTKVEKGQRVRRRSCISKEAEDFRQQRLKSDREVGDGE